MQGSRDRDPRSIVSTAPGAVASDGAAIAFGHPMPDGIELIWKSGERSVFHWIWLRDNCPEGRSWIDGIWTRVRRVVDLPARPQAKGFRIERDGLRVQWTDTSLESYFPSEWLLANSYCQPLAFERLPHELWNASSLGQVPEVRRSLVPDGGREMLDALVRMGVVRIRGGEPRAGFAVPFVSQFGTVIDTSFGKTWRVWTNPDSDARTKDYAYEDLALHTDFTFARFAAFFEFFHCVRPDPAGGASTLVDGFRLAEDLRSEAPDVFSLLSTWPVPYQAITGGHDIRASRPIIALAPDGAVEMIASADRMMAPLRLPPEVMLPFYDAFRIWESRAMSPRYLIEIQLEAGDTMIWDNRRILHGRRGLSRAHGDQRLFEGGYLHADDIESQWRRAHSPGQWERDGAKHRSEFLKAAAR
jgi:gamma-butyrobetaine dioxygenase